MPAARPESTVTHVPGENCPPDSIWWRLQLPTRPSDATYRNSVFRICLRRIFLRSDAVTPRAYLALGCPTTWQAKALLLHGKRLC